MSGTTAFRPDVQGIRALAVGSVLLFHIFPDAVPGGYVGVDIFFVVSGYLITGLLLRDVAENGQIRIGNFYLRRIRRLLPAASLVLLTIAAFTVLLPPSRWLPTAQEIIASALWSENWYLAWKSVDYLNSELPPSPLQHFWSLGIEEQFYLVWPALIMLCAAFCKLTRIPLKAILFLIFGAAFGVSLYYSVTLSSVDPAAYFYTHTRVWELAIGGIIAAFAPARLPGPVRLGLTVAGLGLAIAPMFMFSTATVFPGYWALLPVGGAVLLLVGGLRGPEDKPGLVTSLALENPVSRWLGDVSYSLYLWHWPIIIFYKAIVGSPPNFMEGVGLIAICLAVSHLSKTLIEDRFRAPPKGGRRLPTFAFAGVSIATCAAASFAIMAYVEMGRNTAVAEIQEPTVVASAVPAVTAPAVVAPVAVDTETGLPAATVAPTTETKAARTVARYPGAGILFDAGVAAEPGLPPIPSLTVINDDMPANYEKFCHASRTVVTPPTCVYGAPNGTKRVLLVGDSHAASWLPALEPIAEARGWRLEVFTKSACPFMLGPITRNNKPYPECRDYVENVLKSIEANPPELVLVGQYFDYFVVGKGARGSDEPAIVDDMVAVWQRVERTGAKVVAFRDNPQVTEDPVQCVETKKDKCSFPAKASLPGTDAMIAATARHPSVKLIDLTRYFCGETECPSVIGNVYVWRDKHHFTATYAKTLAPAVRKALVDAGGITP